jgi:hypothetical protein
MISSTMSRDDESNGKRHLADMGKFLALYLLFILCFITVLLLS